MIKKIIIGIVALIIVFIVVSMSLITWERLANPKVSVLGYHAFATTEEMKNLENTDFTMDIAYFEKQLKFLKDNNFKVLTLDEFYDYHQKGKDVPYKSVLITMDDGYQSNYDLAFPLLKKYNMPATVFVVGEYSKNGKEGYMSLETIEKAKEEYPNITFASHSYGLHGEGKIDQEPEKLKLDFEKQEEIIPTKYFAYPYGHYNKKAMEVLVENEYKLAFGFGPDRDFRKASRNDARYLIPRLNISNDMAFWKFKLKLLLPFG